MEKVTNRIRNPQFIIGAALVFCAMLIFFSVINPIIPYDLDDWGYIGGYGGYAQRLPLPKIDAWNPSRVFQEVLTPIVGRFAAFVVFPVTGDYVLSISLVVAFVVAAFITAFYGALCRLLFALQSNKTMCALEGLFLIMLCFLLFDNSAASYKYLFYSSTLTTYFFYTIPNIMNSILVCELLKRFIEGRDLSFESSLKSGFMIVALYFAIFSMQFSAAILAVFCLNIAILRFVQAKGKNFLEKIKNFGLTIIKHNNIVVFVLAGFLIAMVFELAGGRAKADFGDIFFGSILSPVFRGRMRESVLYFRDNILPTINTIVAVLAVILICFAAFLYFRHRKDAKKFLFPVILCLLSSVFSFIFCVLVSAKANMSLTARIDVVYGVFFFLLLIIAMAVLFVLEKAKRVKAIIPLVTTILLLMLSSSRLQPGAGGKGSPEAKAALINSYIDQIKKADDEGKDTYSLHVSESDSVYWPIPDYYGSNIASALFSHRIISKKIEVETVIDEVKFP